MKAGYETMRFRAVLLLFAWILFSGFQFSPETWVKDISKLWKRDKPKYDQIMFWDYDEQKTRGLRAFVYTLAQDWENRQVDRRLYAKLSQLLGHMCQEVITIDSIKDLTQKELVENAIIDMADQWKLRGAVDSQAFFDSMPLVDFDVLVLMERIHYDQEWKGKDKRLVIGVLAAAFEMDFGTPLYNERVMVDIPWSGENTSFRKAEHAALLKIADAMGESFHDAAQQINRTHEKEVEETLQAELGKKRETISVIVAENKVLKGWIKEAENRFKLGLENPKPLTEELKRDIAEIEPFLKKWPASLSPEELERRKRLAASLQNKMTQWNDWLTQEEARQQQEAEAAKPTLGTKPQDTADPGRSQNGQLPPLLQTRAAASRGQRLLPDVVPPSGNPFDRRWLLPQSTPSDRLALPPATGMAQTTQKGSANSLQGQTRVLSPELLKFQQAGGRIPPPPQIPQDFIGRYQHLFKAGKTISSSTPSVSSATAAQIIKSPT